MSTFVARPASAWGRTAVILLMVFLVIPAGLLPGWLFFAPARLAYRVDGGSIVAEATVGGVSMGGGEYARDTLTGATRTLLDPDAVRVGGTAMSGFCAGRWRLADGRAAQLATDCAADVVQLELGSDLLIVTPRDAAGLLAALATPGATWSEEAPVTRGDSTGERVAFLGVALLALSTVGFVAWMASRSLVYRLEGGVLVVPAHFAAVRVPLAGATARKTPLTGAFRLAGTAIPGSLYLGRFRGCGRWLHCASSSVTEGWLIEGERVVYVSPADDAAFAEALRAAGATVTTA